MTVSFTNLGANKIKDTRYTMQSENQFYIQSLLLMHHRANSIQIIMFF